MKQKLITIVLIVIATIVPMIIIPSHLAESSYILKNIILIDCGILLLVLILASYKELKIDIKDIYILLFMGLIFISTCLSTYKSISIRGETSRYEGMLMFTTYICIYLSAKKFFKCDNINKFLNIMFYTSMLIGILGILQNYFDFPKLFPIFGHGIASTFGNSNFFGSYISIALPISICIFIFKEDIKSFILSNIMFFNMISSGTRSAWVAFTIVGVIGLIYLMKQKNKTYWKRSLILLLYFLIIFIYLFSGLGGGTARTKFNQIKNDLILASKEGMADTLGSSRMEIWKMTVKLITKHPFFGCGTDNLKRGLIINCLEDFVAFEERTRNSSR